MFTLDKDILVAYQRIDVPDAPEVELLISAACQQCVSYVDRAIYEDGAERDSALAGLDQATADASQAYMDALAAAELIENSVVRFSAIARASSYYSAALRDIDQQSNGIIANDDIRAAAMLLFGSLWRNRENEVAGTSAAAVALPYGARAILDRYVLWGSVP